MSKKIRVGIINCDTHGMWFALLMNDHDAKLLQQPIPWDQPATYSWQRGIVHYYYYSDYRNPGKLTTRNVEGFTVTRLWDKDRSAAELAARIFHDQPKVCDTFDQVSDDVDLVLIASCNGDGDDHLSLAQPGLEKGVATFIDKPMTFTTDQAVDLLTLANKYHAPILSASLYQVDANTADFARRLPEVGELTSGTVQCSSTHGAATIGAVCATQTIFGDGIQSVSCLEVPSRQVVFHLDYGERTDRPSEGVTIHSCTFDNPFPSTSRFSRVFATAYGWERAIQGMILDGYSASNGASILLEHARTAVQTRQSEQSLTQDMVRAVAVCQAMRQSLETSKQVNVEYSKINL